MEATPRDKIWSEVINGASGQMGDILKDAELYKEVPFGFPDDTWPHLGGL